MTGALCGASVPFDFLCLIVSIFYEANVEIYKASLQLTTKDMFIDSRLIHLCINHRVHGNANMSCSVRICRSVPFLFGQDSDLC